MIPEKKNEPVIRGGEGKASSNLESCGAVLFSGPMFDQIGFPLNLIHLYVLAENPEGSLSRGKGYYNYAHCSLGLGESLVATMS